MAKKKKQPKKQKALAYRPQETSEVSLDGVLKHPSIVDIRSRLEQVQGMLSALPETIARAVAMASQATASGPTQPLLRPKKVEFGPRSVTVDNETYKLPDPEVRK